MALTEDSLRAFLRDRHAVDGLAADAPIFSTGLLDSFALVDVMAFLESEGGFRIAPSDVHLDHLDTIARMLAFARSQGA